MKNLFSAILIAMVFSSCAALKGTPLPFGKQELTVKVVAKRGNSSLVQFEEIRGQFVVKSCEWIKGETVTVFFGSESEGYKVMSIR